HQSNRSILRSMRYLDRHFLYFFGNFTYWNTHVNMTWIYVDISPFIGFKWNTGVHTPIDFLLIHSIRVPTVNLGDIFFGPRDGNRLRLDDNTIDNTILGFKRQIRV